MRILLVQPPSVFLIDDRAFVHLGLLQIAAVAREYGHEVRILDLTGHRRSCQEDEHDQDHVLAWALPRFATTLDEFRPDLVGFYALYAQFPFVVRMNEALHNGWGIPSVIGGPHANTSPEECRAHGFDWVVVSDQGGGGGEAGFLSLLLKMTSPRPVSGLTCAELPTFTGGDSHVLKIPSRPPGVVYDRGEYVNDRWPYPARDLVDLADYKYEIKGRRAVSIVSQAGCPFACHFGFAGAGLLATAGGFMTVEQLHAAASHDLYALCEHGYALTVRGQGVVVAGAEPATARLTQASGMRRCLELSTENGLSASVTYDHTVEIVRGAEVLRLRADEVRIGDWLPVRYGANVWPADAVRFDTNRPRAYQGLGRPPKQPLLPEVLTPEVAWWLGYLVGDGSYSKDGWHVELSVNVSILDDILARTKFLFGESGVVKPTQSDKCVHVILSSRVIWDWLHVCCEIDPNDKLRVPRSILRSPREQAVAFVAGLFAADGHEDADGMRSITTISERLAGEVAAIQVNAGFVPSIKRRTQRTGYGELACYHVVLHLRRRRWPKLIEGRVSYARPSGERPEVAWLREDTVRSLAPNHPAVRPGVCWFPIVSVRDVGEQMAYDVSADGTLSVNGLLFPQCGHNEGYQKLVLRSPAHVEGELRQIMRDYPWVSAVMIYDDEINIRGDFPEFLEMLGRVGQLGDRLIYRGFFKCGKSFMKEDVFAAMAKNGVTTLCTGVEAADPAVLARVGKGATVEDNTRFVELCAKYGIDFKCFSMVGHPGETWASVGRLRDWLISMVHLVDGRVQMEADVTILTPTRHTPIWDRPEKFPDLIFDRSALDFGRDLVHYKGRPGEYKCVTRTPEMTSEDIVAARAWVENGFREAAGLPPLLGGKDDG